MTIDAERLARVTAELRDRLALYFYQPPFAAPEFLAEHGPRLEERARRHAAKTASEVIDIVCAVLAATAPEGGHG